MTKRDIPINLKTLHEATDSDEAVMKELVVIYLDQGGKTIKKLRSAVQHEDPEKVMKVAHRFLGSSRFFGATAIGKPLAALQDMSRSGRLGPTAVKLVDRTEKEFIRIGDYFNALHEKPVKRPPHA
jgi:HPt (histidine-containing phosphotransfer) domain-containing protein